MPPSAHLGKSRRRRPGDDQRQHCYHRNRQAENFKTAQHLWSDLERRIGKLTEHFRFVESVDARRGNLESARLIQTNRILDFERPLRHVVIVSAEGVEGALSVNRPHEALGIDLLAGGSDRRIAPEPGTKM